MSIAEVRGGWPHVFLGSILHTAVRNHRFGFVAKYIKIRVQDNPLKVYFTEEDALADVKYVTIPIPAATAPYGEWEAPAEVRQVWMLGSGGTSIVELVAFQRRG